MAIALGSIAVGCDAGDLTTRVVAWVFHEDVVGNTHDTCVVEDTGLPATGERLDVMGITSSGASTYDPGLYLYAGGFRADGTFFELELDVPAYLGAEVRDLRASYREFANGEPIFDSDTVGGQIQLVSLAGDGGHYVGIFDLRFVDDGRDGLLDTEDDIIRALRFGSFSFSGHEPQRLARPTEVREHDVHVDVQLDIYAEMDPAFYSTTDGCDDSTPEGYGEDIGCEGDTSTDPGGGAGCESDTTGDVGSGGGCEGDTSTEPVGGTGCEGDTGGGCESTALASGSSSRGPSRRPNRIFSACLPFLALLATRFVLRRF